MKTLNVKQFVKKYAIYLVLLALIIIFSIASPQFLRVSNIVNVVRQASMLGIASVGMIFVMIIGGIDLSVGSMVTFVNIIVAYFMVNMGMNPVLASLVGIGASTLIGFFQWLGGCQHQDTAPDCDPGYADYI